jgi:hypothetical protein
MKKDSSFLKRAVVKATSFLISASFVFSLSSCDSIKMHFAGELTDKGISMDSVACGNLYSPENPECTIGISPYDTVFDNCLFVGSGVICDFYKAVGLWRESAKGILGKSIFFCNENFSVYENNYTSPELASSHHPTVEYNGENIKCTVEDAIEKTGVDRVVFCLAGINDLPIYGDEENCHVKTANEMAKLIRKLKEKFLGLSIVVVSTPPISAEATQMKSINNKKISQLNEELSKVCTESGADFIDASKLLCDENGALKKEFCYDGYCKLNEAGCRAILASLRYYAKERKGEI